MEADVCQATNRTSIELIQPNIKKNTGICKSHCILILSIYVTFGTFAFPYENPAFTADPFHI